MIESWGSVHCFVCIELHKFYRETYSTSPSCMNIYTPTACAMMSSLAPNVFINCLMQFLWKTSYNYE